MEQRADRDAYFRPGLRLMRIEEDLQLMERAAGWFSDKWAVPAEAYLESMEAACGGRAVPRWYLVIDEKDEIVAGAGIIDNDFHDRPELTPNLCALYVEENWRGRGIAGCLLELAARAALAVKSFGNQLRVVLRYCDRRCALKGGDRADEGVKGDALRAYHRPSRRLRNHIRLRRIMLRGAQRRRGQRQRRRCL